MHPHRRRIGALSIAAAVSIAGLTACTKDDPAPKDTATPSAAPADPGRPAVVRPAIRPDATFKGKPYAPGAEVVFGIDGDTKLGSNIAKLSDVKATCWGASDKLRVEVTGPKGWKATIVPTAYGAGRADVENPSAGYSKGVVAGSEAAVNTIKDAIRAGQGENSQPVYGMTIKDNNDVRVEIIETSATDSSPVAVENTGAFPFDWAPPGSPLDKSGKGPKVTFALFLNLSCGA